MEAVSNVKRGIAVSEEWLKNVSALSADEESLSVVDDWSAASWDALVVHISSSL